MPNKIAVLLPAYRRPEYTAKCLQAMVEAQEYPNADFFLVDDGSEDTTEHLLQKVKLPNKCVWVRRPNAGLRSVILSFFKLIMANPHYKYIVKMDNDCMVPKNWLNDLVAILESGKADVVSPNVMPSDAAKKYGEEPLEGEPGLRRSHTVGGLWAMKSSLLHGIQFEAIETNGLTGAFSLLEQIIIEKEPRVAWASEVTVQDVGHWSGQHPEHIASEEHREYSAQVGRDVSW